jgi:predicted amidohydrolase
MKKYAVFFAIIMILSLPLSLQGKEMIKTKKMVSISTLCLVDDKGSLTKEYVLQQMQEVERSKYPGLIVAPFMPFLEYREGNEQQDLKEFFVIAKEKNATVIVGLIEHGNNKKTYYTSLALSADGEIIGKYRKSHCVAGDSEFSLGDDLPVFDTPVGKIGLTLTSDFYFPEIYEVLRLKGAEILVWQHYPERFRNHYQWYPLLFSRAYDSHAFLVTAHYADQRTYITNRYGIGMQGAAFGKSMVIDRSGIARADTGNQTGYAHVNVDIYERKKDVYIAAPNFENLFYVPYYGSYKTLTSIAEKWEKPQLPQFKKRKARIAIAFCSADQIWTDDAYPEALFELLDKAAEHKPDLVLLSEYFVRKPDKPSTKKAMEGVGNWAAKNQCYVAMAGLGDETYLDGALHVWDRSGKIIFIQGLYWARGVEGLKVFDTDFARVGAHICGDLCTFPIDRVVALQGAELIIDPSQMWGPSGYYDELLLRARAVDNGCYLACVHWNSSDEGLRSVVIDPYGKVLLSSAFMQHDVAVVDIDFSQKKVYYEGNRPEQVAPGEKGLYSYLSGDLPEQKQGWRDMIFSNRRPELYGIIPTRNKITEKYIKKDSPFYKAQ